MNGYGKILRVDLTTSSVWQEEITPELARQYLSVAIFGMNCDLPDYPAITYLQHLSNELGMDIQEGGSIPAFLMELWERGLIGEREASRWAGRPLRFEWGDLEAVEEVAEVLAREKALII